jgi:hypothetical protein
MSFPLVTSDRKCPKPFDFSSHYSMNVFKKQSQQTCGNLSKELPGLEKQSFRQVGGSTDKQRTQYSATGEIETVNCGCSGQSGGSGEPKLCKVYASNTAMISTGPSLALHAEPIGQRPVVSIQSQTTGNSNVKSMLDKQFNCLQPNWCKNCD